MKKDRIIAIVLMGLELLAILGILILTGRMICQYASTEYEAEKPTDQTEIQREQMHEQKPENTGEMENGEEYESGNSSDLNIRVQLLTENYQSKYHEQIEIVSDSAYTVTWLRDTDDGREQEVDHLMLQAEEPFKMAKEALAQSEFLRIEAKGSSLLELHSMKRADGYPGYSGTLYVYSCEEGLILINELPLETYLCSVVSSEMPSWYPLEAQMAQAVCARTYAWKHMNEDTDDSEESDFKTANLDDSVMYQVYNNYRSTESSEEAVRLTEGQILSTDEPLYYSTSCLSENREDLAEEEKFRQFLDEEPESEKEYGSAWLRWEVTLSESDIRDNVSRYYTEFQTEDALTDIQVLERSGSGQVQRLMLNRQEEQLIVEGEYQIRCILGVPNAEITLMDGGITTGMQLLPSAFFYLADTLEDGTVTVYGGGYGHGIGMSQCGAAQMASEGKSYQEILAYYYGEEAAPL